MNRLSPLTIHRARTEAELNAAAEAGALAATAFVWRRPDVLTAHELKQLTANEEVWIALRGETVAGMLSLYPPSFIHFLFVTPDARRHGVGRALLEHIRERTKGPLVLKVDTANKAAIRFYESLGWQRIVDGADSSGNDNGIPWAGYRLD